MAYTRLASRSIAGAARFAANRSYRTALAATWVLLAATVVRAGEDAEHVRFFETSIRPLLVNHCVECHGPDEQESGLRLDRQLPAAQGGERGPAWVSHRPTESLLIQAVGYADDDLQMPPDARLSDEQVAALTKWVEQGAHWPPDVGAADEAPRAAQRTMDERIASAREELWSLRPIGNPQPPAIESESVRDDVDRFIMHKLNEAGLTPAPAADRATLVRRVHFDLIGLPPTLEQAQQFIRDESPGALERLIDELLASPHYGERWGRHWLDVARYADTKGYDLEGDRRFPFSYTYRDYVIRAFNEDKPFDRFLREQLAADQMNLGENDPDLAALGFLTVGRRFLNRQHEIIDDRIDVTTRGMLGLTVSCARCHDHKFDPISTADYYALHGVFQSTHEPEELPVIGALPDTEGFREYQAELNKRQQAADDYLVKLRADIEQEARGRTGDYLRNIAAAHQAGTPDKVQPDAPRGSLRPAMVERWREFLGGEASRQVAAFAAWHLVKDLPRDGWPQGAAEKLRSDERIGGDAELVAALLAPNPPADLTEFATRLGAYLESALEQSKTEAGRQGLSEAGRVVADWLQGETSPTNLQNEKIERFWAQQERNHFRGLEKKVTELTVTSPHAPPRAMVLRDNDQPTHTKVFLRGDPRRRGELVQRRFLDALRPVVGGDQFAADHSGRLELAEAITHPDNPLTARVIVNRVWLHHFGDGLVATPDDFGLNGTPPTHPELLDHLARWLIDHGWSIKQLHRKIMLTAAYQRSSQSHEQAAQIDEANRLLWRQNRRRLEFEPLRDAMLLAGGTLDRTIGGKPVDLEARPFSARRSVYGFLDREDLGKLFSTFDLPNPDASVGKRPETTVPQQPLYLLNNPFVLAQAKAVAARTEVRDAANRSDKVAAIYRAVLARDPTEEEQSAAADYVSQEYEAWDQDESRFPPLARLAQVLLISNEFAFVD